jgi:hypothetical protein
MPDWAPPTVDSDRPSAARCWDYLPGGAHNFAVDRQVAQELIKFKPDLPELARSVRVFLRRSVQLMAEAGLVELTPLASRRAGRGRPPAVRCLRGCRRLASAPFVVPSLRQRTFSQDRFSLPLSRSPRGLSAGSRRLSTPCGWNVCTIVVWPWGYGYAGRGEAAGPGPVGTRIADRVPKWRALCGWWPVLDFPRTGPWPGASL